MRVTKGHRNNRRSHHALKAPRLSVCSNCGAYHQRHRVCLECGYYKGEKVLDIVKVKKAEEKIEAKATKAEVKENKKATKTEAKKETVKKSTASKGDDLTKVEGIGPKTAEVLNKAGIKTFADLAASKVGDLRTLLEENGLNRYDPKTWSKQARLARDKKWDELKTLQDELKGGE